MNKILKIFAAVLVLAMPAWADDDVAFDDTRTLAERTDCAAVASEIAKINGTEDADEDMLLRLTELQTIQRRDCSKNTSRRRAMGRGGKMAAVVAAANGEEYEYYDEEYVESTPEEDIDVVTVTDDEISELDCPTLEEKIDGLRTSDGVHTADINVLTAEYDARCSGANTGNSQDVAELIAAGLCADGTKPNKFGCCGDEKFKDLGGGVFGCCPASGGDCFPPITNGGI